MRIISFILLMTSLGACTQREADPQQFSEDYVLIEFAAKLEEEYHRMHNTPYGSNHAHPSPDEKLPEEVIIDPEQHDQD